MLELRGPRWPVPTVTALDKETALRVGSPQLPGCETADSAVDVKSGREEPERVFSLLSSPSPAEDRQQPGRLSPPFLSSHSTVRLYFRPSRLHRGNGELRQHGDAYSGIYIRVSTGCLGMPYKRCERQRPVVSEPPGSFYFTTIEPKIALREHSTSPHPVCHVFNKLLKRGSIASCFVDCFSPHVCFHVRGKVVVQVCSPGQQRRLRCHRRSNIPISQAALRGSQLCGHCV
ncbi:hypothetical protein FQA47_019210 [Oryzias melastigma]|uniref:Uncharacterized protein n=1 Tax=Oryzias melastigma TaxID=30732 RepID=A0A834FFD8_ORYME|nr:hypothetical protein FQA47_019210 [Oryzias melastigma]